MQLVAAMLDNPHLYMDPYVSALIPSILTCLIGRNLGPSLSLTSTEADFLASYPLRDLSASLFKSIAQKYAPSSHTLKPRLARTCLKHFLDPSKPLATNYGGIIGLQAVGGQEVGRAIVIPNLKNFGDLILKEAYADEREGKRKEADVIMKTLVKVVMEVDEIRVSTGGESSVENGQGEALMGKLKGLAGETVAEKMKEVGGGEVVEKLARLLQEGAQDGIS